MVERVDSSEPRSRFVTYVEREAFKPKNTRRSVVYHSLGDKFPYLQMLAASADFEFLTPAQIAAIYVVARTRPDDWHTICARPNALNCALEPELVDTVNAYFRAVEEPQSDELHEMHQMFNTFMRSPADPSVVVDSTGAAATQTATHSRSTVTFLAVASAFDSAHVAAEFREHAALLDSKKAAPSDSVCAMVFRSFAQDTQWFAKQ